MMPQTFCPDGKLFGPSKTQNAHLQVPLYEAVFGAVAVSILTQVQPGPVAPVAPFGPVGPCGPVAPVAPLGPWAPVAPVGPVAPRAPVSPFGPGIPYVMIPSAMGCVNNKGEHSLQERSILLTKKEK